MADNYLENKMEEHLAPKNVTSKRTASLDSLLLRNRSQRGYDSSIVVRADHLRRIIGVNTRIPSARNQQVLRFRAVLQDEAGKVLPHIRLGGALPEWHLPLPGTEPQSFIVICTTVPESRYVDIDLGISAQSMLLKAVEMGLNGICIGAFDKEAIRRNLQLPYEPILIIAIGKGCEKIKLLDISEEESHQYHRENGIHYVPKVRLSDLMLESK